MAKVTIQLLGGLGNNLFQIAAAYAYAKRTGKELALVKEKFGTTHGVLDSYQNNILSNIEFVSKFQIDDCKFNLFTEQDFTYAPIPKIDGDVGLNGYFQSEKYFKDFSVELRELLSFPAEYKAEIIDKYKEVLKHNTCSLHVRRGDYVSLSEIHPAQNINYYMKAIRQMPEDSVFVIFSDDIQWCKDNLPNIPEKFIFIEGNPDYEDLLLMSLCENHITANSSFSWWGAWLNANENKKVISPSKWFGPVVNHNTKDLYCDNWVKI